MITASYQEPSLESFCDSLIREQDNLIHLGIINNADTSGKALLFQQKEKSKPPKKHNFRNNKPNNKGPKPSQPAPSLKNDKRSKTIYLSIKLLDYYVQNAKLRKKTNNVFIIYFQNLDLHILFLYLHSTP